MVDFLGILASGATINTAKCISILAFPHLMQHFSPSPNRRCLHPSRPRQRRLPSNMTGRTGPCTSNGIAQEACHDFVHTGYGFTSISYMAETTPIQGMDPYGTDVGWRYRLGIHSKYDLAAFPERGLEAGSWPERICHTIQL